MKIIIFSILFTVQAQYIEDDSVLNDNSSIRNDFNLVTQIINDSDRINFFETSKDFLSTQFIMNEMNFSTITPEIISSDITYESQTWPSIFTHDSFSSTFDFDLTTVTDETKIKIEQQWFNVNQSNRQDPYKSILFWKQRIDPLQKSLSYILTSEPRCIHQMCTVRLKYNGTLSTRTSGCLSFSLRARGQPFGQLWIVEDQKQENRLQTIQLTNKTLRIEHSLKSKIKNLSIETRILFRNPQIDRLILSNLNVKWKGPCPKYRLIPTPSSNNIVRRATLDDNLMTLSSEGSGFTDTLTTNEEFQSSQEHLIYESTTIIFNEETNTKRSFSFMNQKNYGWFLSLIALFCFLTVLSGIGYSLWLIRRQHHFSWYLHFDTQIQLLARRSIRSSTRSENKIATISEIAYDILNNDSQKEQAHTPTTNSSRSTPMSYYTYL